MSQRGSFVTQYLNCRRCFEAAKAVLVADGKFLKGVAIPAWAGMAENRELPIVAGKIGGTWPGEELHTFDFELAPALELLICHPMRIAVLAEGGEARVFTVVPRASE